MGIFYHIFSAFRVVSGENVDNCDRELTKSKKKPIIQALTVRFTASLIF